MRTFVGIAAAAIALLVAVAPAGAAPEDGGGNQFVVVFDDVFPVDCGAAGVIELHVGGWLKGREFQGGGTRNVELVVFHIVLTYTNQDGATFRYVDVGPASRTSTRTGTSSSPSPADREAPTGPRSRVAGCWSSTRPFRPAT